MVTVRWGLAARRATALDDELRRVLPLLRDAPGVEEVWAFGSTVAGGVHLRSDLDLPVVRRTAEPFLQRAATLHAEVARNLHLRRYRRKRGVGGVARLAARATHRWWS